LRSFAGFGARGGLSCYQNRRACVDFHRCWLADAPRRNFRQDQRDNGAVKQQQVHTPVLYLRGGAEHGIELERYLAGFREHGLCELAGDVMAGSGHFTPDEQPDALARRIAAFLKAL
jgi:pimeloyl-ACP methyl ester carboxylesterase